MIPLTAEELATLLAAREILADKGIGTAVMVLDMVLHLAGQLPSDDQPSTATELES